MLKGRLYLLDPLQAEMSQLGPEPKQTVFHCGSLAPARHQANALTLLLGELQFAPRFIPGAAPAPSDGSNQTAISSGRRLTSTPMKCTKSSPSTPFYSKCPNQNSFVVVKTVILTFLKPLLWAENKVFWHIQTLFTFDWKSKSTSAQNSFDYLGTASVWSFHSFFVYFKLF